MPTILAAFLGAVGVLEAAVAWFGPRAGAPWALATLTAGAALLAASDPVDF